MSDPSGAARTDDEQDRAEALDADKVGTDPYDRSLGSYPPEEYQGALDYGTIPSEEQVDEPIADHVAREEPDPLAEELDRSADRADREDRRRSR